MASDPMQFGFGKPKGTSATVQQGWGIAPDVGQAPNDSAQAQQAGGGGAETTDPVLGSGVSPDVGKTAAEGAAAAAAGNATLNAGLAQRSNQAQPGNGKPFYPDADVDTPKPKVPGRL